MAALQLYTDLLIRAISNTIYGDPAHAITGGTYDAEKRHDGRDWPSMAHSMAGELRLRNVAELTQRVLDEDVPGDLIETGVWRGGCCILMKGILQANQDTSRKVFLCDSFAGLPAPDVAHYPRDAGLDLSIYPELAIGERVVRDNFKRYGLLDESVVTVPGWFKDTLHTVPSSQFALVRLDGDLYESTMQGLKALYPRLAPGGFIIIDDYGCLPQCADAVHDYRAKHAIHAPIIEIDWTGVWWQKES
jgi:O-methyltransferase